MKNADLLSNMLEAESKARMCKRLLLAQQAGKTGEPLVKGKEYLFVDKWDSFRRCIYTGEAWATDPKMTVVLSNFNDNDPLDVRSVVNPSSLIPLN